MEPFKGDLLFWISVSIYLYLYDSYILNIRTLRGIYFLDPPRGLASDSTSHVRA